MRPYYLNTITCNAGRVYCIDLQELVGLDDLRTNQSMDGVDEE